MAICTVLAYFGVFMFSGNFLLVYGDLGNTWGYQDGIPPRRWPEEYRTCGGTRQSPIDIQINQVVVDDSLEPFDLRDLENLNNIRMTMKNNGHTVEVDIEGQNRIVISGGGFFGQYIVKQFHFHWGTVDRRGCEHDINGRRFPMEMHVVTYSSRFRMFEEAKNATGGLAVLSFLFDIGEDNHAFAEIITHMDSIAHKDDYIDIQTFSLTSLFPESRDVFYRYYGGLTTPPCYESVIWTIFQEHIKISERQINVFRHLGDRHFNRFREISDNFRPTQPLNGRQVYTNNVRGLQYRRIGQFPGSPMIPGRGQFPGSSVIPAGGQFPGSSIIPGRGQVPGQSVFPGRVQFSRSSIIPGRGQFPGSSIILRKGQFPMSSLISRRRQFPGSGRSRIQRGKLAPTLPRKVYRKKYPKRRTLKGKQYSRPRSNYYTQARLQRGYKRRKSRRKY